MCVLLFDVFKHLLSRKTSQTCLKSKRNKLALKSKKVQGIFEKTIILALFSSALFHLQACVSDFFKIALFGRSKVFIRVP